MNDLIMLNNAIEDKIKLLEKMRAEIKSRAEQKAITISEYDKQLAITIIKLKNNNITEWEGENIVNLPATLIEKIAKGICSRARNDMEIADGLYKSVISNIDSVQAELNGYQSINKHLSIK